MRSAYDILGVPRSATADSIRVAYRKLAKVFHPDANAGDPGASERFLEIRAAYEILIDPLKRAAYDLAPEGSLDDEVLILRRRSLKRRRKRLMKLY
jgi:molecular chaperone DnaJ